MIGCFFSSFKGLPKFSGAAKARSRERTPQLRGMGGIAFLTFTALCCLAFLSTAARAEPAAQVETTAGLDGTYVALGPAGGATFQGGEWDSIFGGELVLARVDEGRALSAFGVALGGGRFGVGGRGRLWADVLVATNRLPFVTLGLAGGVIAEVGEVGHNRWGGAGTLFAYAGVMPYVRVGAVARSGRFVELGLRIPLPALRWR